jgi:DNA polymerase elongation subunit (family B)
MFDIIDEYDPDVIAGYNSEDFDHEFFDVFLREHFGVEMGDETKRPTLKEGSYKKKHQSVLKLGGEMEYYYPTVIWGKHVTDCLFSVRRAQALDSNMKKATLKYVTKYSKINKKNRVYVNGKIIGETWKIKENIFAFNDDNGDWYRVDDKHPLKDGYEMVSGNYIVQRYLLDDLWETDKVELRYNESNFLVSKMLPVKFERMCTMGTATIWKYIIMGWSDEHNLAIPLETSSRSFTGGLSRLLTVGYIPNVQKLDYNSLYPSIILSFGIKSPIDISGAMPAMLEYILTQREYFKGLKGEYGKKAKKYGKECDELIESLRLSEEYMGLDDKAFASVIKNNEHLRILREQQEEASALSTRNDKMQLPLKITGNAYFGSFGSGGGVFPWSDIDCAEETTCCGRQMLRLMLKWFTDLGYEGIVCDSVTGDTPLFIRHDNMISIKPIGELFGNKGIDKYNDGREYDRNEKDYEVLCRSGWVKPSYFYKHETNKDVYRVENTETNVSVDVTKDHSLFDENQNEIKPEQITKDTKLEYYNGESIFTFNSIEIPDKTILDIVMNLKFNTLKEIPDEMLNATLECKNKFLETLFLTDTQITLDKYSKTIVAGFNYIKNTLLNS